MDIRQEHPEFRSWKSVWPKYCDLYRGGEELIANSHRYLVQRQNEPVDVYQERLSRVFYENYIGSIVDWYAATLFRREPLILYEGGDERVRAYYNEFAEDCDLRGSTISDFFRRQLTTALVFGKSYVLIDFPKPKIAAQTRAEEELSGASRGYICEYSPENVINWQRDPAGDLDWLVLRFEESAMNDPDSSDERKGLRWVYYDRQRYAVYRSDGSRPDSRPPALVEEGFHGLRTLNRVPVIEFSLGEGLWLMNKVASLQLEHFNKSNALAWALTMGLFAMPVIYSEREWSQCVGESYYIQLGPGDKFGWTEPEGHVYEIALKNIDRLKDEIYRVCYLSHQAGGALSKNSALTGLSKQRDYLITQEVLRRFGDQVKDTLKLILRTIAAIRKDEVGIGVSGLDEFDIGDFSSELDEASRLLQLGIPSDTMKRQVFKKLAMKYLCDVSQTVKEQIAREIDEN